MLNKRDDELIPDLREEISISEKKRKELIVHSQSFKKLSDRHEANVVLLKKQIDRQHEEIQEIKNKLKLIISET